MIVCHLSCLFLVCDITHEHVVAWPRSKEIGPFFPRVRGKASLSHAPLTDFCAFRHFLKPAYQKILYRIRLFV